MLLYGGTRMWQCLETRCLRDVLSIFSNIDFDLDLIDPTCVLVFNLILILKRIHLQKNSPITCYLKRLSSITDNIFADLLRTRSCLYEKCNIITET